MDATGKPIIGSIVMWDGENFPEIRNSVFLHCVSEYPAYFTNDIFPARFDKLSGFSDHSIGCYWAREAIKRGATIIEKHFTLSHELPGYNQKGSAEPWELKELVTYARQYERGIQY